MNTQPTPEPLYIVTSDTENYYIVNIKTLRSKNIGRIGKGRGINYLDRAREEATRRNGGIKAITLWGHEFKDVLSGKRKIDQIYNEEV